MRSSIYRQKAMFETDIETLVSQDHKCRKLYKLVDREKVSSVLSPYYKSIDHVKYHPVNGFMMLLWQFVNDLSDRQMEMELVDSLSAKWFCGFDLLDDTPDHSYFGEFRKRIGCEGLSKIFEGMVKGMKKDDLVREIFTFIDSSSIEARVDQWRARDKAIADIENEETDDDDKPTMNNKNVSNYSTDPDARFGAKSKSKIWLGYKRHVAVDCRSGFKTGAYVTPANVSDPKGAKYVLPSQGAVFADKAYSEGEAREKMKEKDIHNMAIKKNNNKSKNRDLDRFISKVRMPFEGVFSKVNKTAKYIGRDQVQFQVTAESIAFNFKRALTLKIEKIPIILN